MHFPANPLRLFSLLVASAVLATGASAATISTTGTFAADNSTYSVIFYNPTSQNVSFSTTSYSTGGFVPDLTLFNAAGKNLDNSGPGISDASLTDLLAPGSYILYLTEFPNVANGNLSAGFLFANMPSVTGTDCSVPGGMFYDDITCAKRTSAFSLAINSATPLTVTPEPATFFLVLPPMLLLLGFARRQAA